MGDGGQVVLSDTASATVALLLVPYRRRGAGRATPALAFTVGAMWLDQDQERPDASAYEWNQTRLNARITYVLSSSDKRATGVPGVIERMPSMTGMGR